MKLIKKSRLHFQEGNSDKVYEVDLCELTNRKDERYVVNFRYGKRGATLREGTKTSDPVTLDTAEKLFSSVVVSKENKGYRDSTAPTAPVTDSGLAFDGADAADHSILTASLLTSLKKEKNSRRRGRILWRLGEVGNQTIASDIAHQIGKGHWLEDYSAAWAIGRINGVQAIDKIRGMLEHNEVAVRAMAFEVLLLLADSTEQEQLLDTSFSCLSPTLADAIKSDDQAEIFQQMGITLKAPLEAGDSVYGRFNEVLIACYQLALTRPSVHQALLKYLDTVPLIPGFFRAVRAIYKTAEFRLDAPMFALLANRFETTKHYFRIDEYWDCKWIPGVGSVSVSDEFKSSSSRLAYSNKTRDYLRRRNWRSIKRLGTCEDDRYVSMATEILLAVRDDPVQPELPASSQRECLLGFIALNHILYEHSEVYRPAPNGRSWYITGAEDSGERTECFPQLWDKNPQAALRLLKESKCAPVHVFARRVLDANPSYCELIRPHDLMALLSSPYQSTCEFALCLVKAQLVKGCSNIDLILALLKSTLKEARLLGIDELRKQSLHSGDTRELAELLLIQRKGVQVVVHETVKSLSFTKPEQVLLLQLTVKSLLDCSVALDESFVFNLGQFLSAVLESAVRQFDINWIEALLVSNSVAKQLFGAHLLLGHSMPFSEIPDAFLQIIHESGSSTLRGVGVALLGKQPDQQLIGQLTFLLGLFQAGDAPERQSLLNIFKRLAKKNDDWLEQVLQGFLAIAFKAEPQEGLHDEVVDFVTKELRSGLFNLPSDVIWRMTQAQSTAAQRIGANAIKNRKVSDYSVKQWAILGKNPDVSVRYFVQSIYTDNVAIMRESSRAALLILDNPWRDTQVFGFDFFNNNFTEDDWSTDAIIFLCDSVNESIQRFGRDLLQRYFKKEQGVEYLLKLSQHPTSNVQLFVSSFLEDHAGGRPERILQLRNYFVTVLSQVNKGRISKDRVIKFLSAQALLDKTVAVMVADVFGRVSLTMVHADKGKLIQSMLALKASYPDVSLPMINKKIAIKPLRSAGSPPVEEVAQ